MNKLLYLLDKMLNAKKIKTEERNQTVISLDTLLDENVTYSIEGSKLVIKSIKDIDLS